MEIKTNVLNENKNVSTGKVTAMKLDESSQAMIFQMFTGGLYSDPIGTVIREITSNCFDSHIEAGVNSKKIPVIVRLNKDISGHHISFIDQGVGMSPDRVENIYGTYFKSTKRTTNDQIGGFGLGGKTPLAYTESFYIITRHDGTEYTYNIFEDNQQPSIELMASKPTKLDNGTEVKVPVKESDIMEFQRKTLRQLYYFENVIFEGFDSYVTNEYKILKGKSFIYRGSNYDHVMHACYGRVAYPLDYEALGLERNDYAVPVAIRLDIGELDGTGVTPSREALKYSKKNIDIIRKRMNEAIEELKGMLSRQHFNVVELKDYFHTKNSFRTLHFDDDAFQSIDLGTIVQKSDIDLPNFKYNNLKFFDANDLFDSMFDVKIYGKPRGKSYYGSRNVWDENFSNINGFNNIYYFNSPEFKRVVLKQSYLKHISSTDNFFIITPKNFKSESTINALKLKLGVIKETLDFDTTTDEVVYENVIAKAKGDKLIKNLIKDMIAWVEGTTKNYKKVEVSEDFIEMRKNARKNKELLKVGIPLKSYGSYYGNAPVRHSMKTLLSFKGMIIYGFQDDDHALTNAFKIMKSLTHGKVVSSDYIDRGNERSQGVIIVRIAQGNEKYMKMLGRKAFHVKELYERFVSRKVDAIVKSCMASLVSEKLSKLCDVFDRTSIMKHIDSKIAKNLTDIKEFVRENKNKHQEEIDYSKFNKLFKVNLNAVGLKDFSMYNELVEILKANEKSRGRLQWFKLPYELNMENESHKELIFMISMMIEE